MLQGQPTGMPFPVFPLPPSHPASPRVLLCLVLSRSYPFPRLRSCPPSCGLTPSPRPPLLLRPQGSAPHRQSHPQPTTLPRLLPLCLPGLHTAPHKARTRLLPLYLGPFPVSIILLHLLPALRSCGPCCLQGSVLPPVLISPHSPCSFTD